MTFEQVKYFYESKENVSCEITIDLIKSGFHQRYGTGYLSNVKSGDIPSQWLHIMNYCSGKEKDKPYPYTPCGELVFWMAEVSNSVSKKELKELADKIIKSGYKENRRIWNREITKLCWKNTKQKIEGTKK